MKFKAVGCVLLASVFMAGCQSTSMTKTKETKKSYVIYDVKVDKSVSPSEMAKAIKTQGKIMNISCTTQG
ncbi:hypothetical protein [Vibrio navarrensis]|uniref:hypothetical protein n=1 Tax=Vibrio navarrensis TaxID=29495 RepID=UPI00186A1D37|nr:hypothetical protein [Vibrio navarrensis]MBE4583272.1 hypothetical protein [Vibrio navarrensis]